ncbi:DNA-3-methyladenine glycosylase family protein [Winogradskyella sp.]|uniref:DNA-3-methyladenine glycosylase family protein n=1 Tax=Winogradskyella sp. TaxID=1883156 RepID=UPI003BA87912
MQKAIQHLRKVDPHLNKITSRISIPTLQWSGDVFEDLVSCILDMQIRYRGKAMRYKRLKELINGERITHYNLFSIREEGFKFINMSSQKYNALMNLCSYWEAHKLEKTSWQDLSDTDVRELLINIKGIGNWTIDMILLFTLQRENIVPLDDFHLKKAVKTIYNIQDDQNLKEEMQYLAEDWAPYGSVAVLYLLELTKN